MADPTQLRNLTDLQLVSALCTESDDNPYYIEFVNRFVKELKEECIRICKRRKVDEQVGEEIAHICFEKFRRSKSFDVGEINQKDPHKAVLIYLVYIARNSFNDRDRKIKRQERQTQSKSHFADIFGPGLAEASPEKLQRIRDMTMLALQQLSDDEKTVLIADYEYKRDHTYLPRDINAMLAEQLGVEKATIRKIRQRGTTKLKKAIHANQEA